LLNIKAAGTSIRHHTVTGLGPAALPYQENLVTRFGKAGATSDPIGGELRNQLIEHR
jgi:hypothetical protein